MSTLLLGEYRRYRLFEVDKITRAGNLYPREVVEKALAKISMQNTPVWVAVGPTYPIDFGKIVGDVGEITLVNNFIEVSLNINRATPEGKVWDTAPEDLDVQLLVSVVAAPGIVDGVKTHHVIKDYNIHHVVIMNSGMKASKFLRKGRRIMDQFIAV